MFKLWKGKGWVEDKSGSIKEHNQTILLLEFSSESSQIVIKS